MEGEVVKVGQTHIQTEFEVVTVLIIAFLYSILAEIQRDST